MVKTKYECKKCGRPFQAKPEEKEPECPHCGSKDVAPRPDRSTTTCGTRGRFS